MTARTTPTKPAAAGMEMFGEINKQLDERREEGLGDDLFSDILRGTLDGKPLDDIQITMYGFLMMLGGDGHHQRLHRQRAAAAVRRTRTSPSS